MAVTWTCASCGTCNGAEQAVCIVCAEADLARAAAASAPPRPSRGVRGRTVVSESPGGATLWICPKCDTRNEFGRLMCLACRTPPLPAPRSRTTQPTVSTRTLDGRARVSHSARGAGRAVGGGVRETVAGGTGPDPLARGGVIPPRPAPWRSDSPSDEERTGLTTRHRRSEPEMPAPVASPTVPSGKRRRRTFREWFRDLRE